MRSPGRALGGWTRSCDIALSNHRLGTAHTSINPRARPSEFRSRQPDVSAGTPSCPDCRLLPRCASHLSAVMAQLRPQLPPRTPWPGAHVDVAVPLLVVDAGRIHQRRCHPDAGEVLLEIAAIPGDVDRSWGDRDDGGRSRVAGSPPPFGVVPAYSGRQAQPAAELADGSGLAVLSCEDDRVRALTGRQRQPHAADGGDELRPADGFTWHLVDLVGPADVGGG